MEESISNFPLQNQSFKNCAQKLLQKIRYISTYLHYIQVDSREFQGKTIKDIDSPAPSRFLGADRDVWLQRNRNGASPSGAINSSPGKTTGGFEENGESTQHAGDRLRKKRMIKTLKNGRSSWQ